jgi:spore coat protein U-like protein
MRRIKQFAASAVLLLLSSTAWGQLGCSVGMGSIQFGNVNQVGGSDSTSTGSMSLSCWGASTPFVRVCISLGAPVDSSWDPRYLVGQQSGDRLQYNIYKDAAYTQIWGSAYSTSGSPRAVDLPVSYGSGNTQVSYYGKVPIQDDARADTYNSTYRYASDAAVRAIGYTGSPPDCSSSMPIVSYFEFGVWATVQNDCSITASSLDFGVTGAQLATTARDAVSTLSVRCTSGTNYNVALDAGTGSGASVAQRRMTRDSGSETLLYGLYLDSARSQIWGDGSSGTSTLSGTGNGTQSTTAHSVYGRLVPQAQPTTGTYRDTITATIMF